MTVVRTIDEVLTELESLLASPGGVDRESGIRVVQEYVEVVGPAIALLGRCAAWAERGLLVEATSVAEDFPRLTSLGERLVRADLASTVARTFRELAPRGISIPTVDPRWIDVLERADGEVERFDKLLERLQANAIGRAPLLERLKTIRQLIRQDPSSKLWLEELGRLEDAALAELRAAMLQAQQQGDADGVQRSAGEILRDQWTRSVPDELRKEARAVVASMQSRHGQARYTELVAQIRDAHAAADEPSLDRLELEWVQVQQTTGAVPPAETESAVEPAFRWLAQLRQQRERDREFQTQVKLLETLLETRGSETEIGRQLGIVKAFDRELPPGLEQRVQHALDVIQSARQRRLLLRIAAVVAVVVVAAATVWWRVGRLDAQERAAQIAAEIDRKLEAHELEEAQSLVDSNAGLFEEPALLTAASRIRERRPAWEKDRTDCEALLIDAREAAMSPVPPARRADLQARATRLSDRLRRSERQELEKAMASVVSQANAYLDDLQDRFRTAWDDWQRQSRAVASLDALPSSEGWQAAFLKEHVERCASVAGAGRDISQRHAELGDASLAALRGELARLDAIVANATERIKAIDGFRSQFSSLVSAADDPPIFLDRYKSLITEQAAVLTGLGLTNAFRDGMEQSLTSWKLVDSWNAMVKALDGVRLTERRDPLTADQASAIESFLQLQPDGAQSKLAESIQKMASRIDADGQPIGERLAGRLADSGIGDLKVIPLVNNGRLFRRIAEPDGPYNSGVLQTRDDVASSDLGDITPRPQRDTDRPARQAPTSERVQRLASALKPLGLRECRQRVLACIGEIVADQSGSQGEEGAAFRLWVVVQLLDTWQASLSVDPKLPVDAEAARVLADLRQADHSPGMDFDWGRPVRTPEEAKRAKEADAAALRSMRVLAALPGLRVGDAKQLDAVADQLRPIEPVGAIGDDPVAGAVVAFKLGRNGPYLVWRSQGGSLRRLEFADGAALQSDFRSRRSGPTLVFKVKEKP
jgi:hypothetical protein